MVDKKAAPDIFSEVKLEIPLSPACISIDLEVPASTISTIGGTQPDPYSAYVKLVRLDLPTVARLPGNIDQGIRNEFEDSSSNWEPPGSPQAIDEDFLEIPEPKTNKRRLGKSQLDKFDKFYHTNK